MIIGAQCTVAELTITWRVTISVMKRNENRQFMCLTKQISLPPLEITPVSRAYSVDEAVAVKAHSSGTHIVTIACQKHLQLSVLYLRQK